MTNLNALADRVEEARGGDRLLDAEIEVAVGNWSDDHYRAWLAYEEAGEMASELIVDVPVPPRWLTSSLDTAASLVPEGYDWGFACFGARGSESQVWPRVPLKEPRLGKVLGSAKSPARALLAACLRARATGGSHE